MTSLTISYFASMDGVPSVDSRHQGCVVIMTWRQICLVAGCVMGDACIFARLLCTDVVFTHEHFACYPLLGCCKMVKAQTPTHA